MACTIGTYMGRGLVRVVIDEMLLECYDKPHLYGTNITVVLDDILTIVKLQDCILPDKPIEKTSSYL